MAQAKKVRLIDEAYNYLTQSLSSNPKYTNQSQQTVVSNLITSFLNASLKWHEDKGLFELYDRKLFLDLEVYLKTGWIMKEPFIDALLDIADAQTWRRFAEILEAYEKEQGKR